MITFQALDGTTGTGEVWSPGPVARSVWVLTENSAVPVKLAGRRQPCRELSAYDIDQELLPDNVADYGKEMELKARRPDLYAQVLRIRAHCAPRLRDKDWNEATGQTAPEA